MAEMTGPYSFVNKLDPLPAQYKRISNKLSVVTVAVVLYSFVLSRSALRLMLKSRFTSFPCNEFLESGVNCHKQFVYGI